ncbi:MAG: orotidine-5'-phosphate decarboxylase [Clostridiales bacterium]|jgi:orotidine-5'-phosphate decarboxylase|nr:orotidine-5'-phosphate decarboxylase [Clostridiales bacterium]
MFVDDLADAVIKKRNPSVVGLDTLLEYVPAGVRKKHAELHGNTLKAAAEAIYEFNARIIDSVCDIVPAVKPQLAYFELYGSHGVECFERTVAYAHDMGLLVIADAKRGDIGATATAYAAAYLGESALDGGAAEKAFGADAMTVNPYLGADGVEPFLKRCDDSGKGIFVLVKTSNPSSGQLQDLDLKDGMKVYERVAGLVEEWGEGRVGSYGYASVGAVVGATYPEQAKSLRAMMPHAYILVPGYGAQGGTAVGAAAAFDESGLGAIVNASRSVLRAWKHERWGGMYSEDGFGDAARAEALRMKAELNAAIGATN